MMRRRVSVVIVSLVATACATASPPSVPTTLRYPDVPLLYVPAPLDVPAQARAALDTAWRRLQSGDLRGAGRDYQAARDLAPGLYPAATGLGYVALLERRWDDAAAWFAAALEENGAYVPALSGRADAAISGGDMLAAVRTLDAWLQVEPDGPVRDGLVSRLEVLRLRAVQDELAAGGAAQRAGRLDEAQAALERAMALWPDSAVVLRELARIEAARGALDAAEEHARQAIAIDPGDADAFAALGDVLEAHGRLREAAAAFTRAAALDPRPDWRDRADALTRRADFEALPEAFRRIPTTQAITRAELAALLGSRFESAIERAPRRLAVILTDVRSHWAAAWILPVTRAGLMETLPNHTFQPEAVVDRAGLAVVLWQTLQVLGANRPEDLARWRQAPQSLGDVPATHLAAAAIAAVVASGAMGPADVGRFHPSRPVTGAEAVAALARLEQVIRP